MYSNRWNQQQHGGQNVAHGTSDRMRMQSDAAQQHEPAAVPFISA